MEATTPISKVSIIVSNVPWCTTSATSVAGSAPTLTPTASDVAPSGRARSRTPGWTRWWPAPFISPATPAGCR